MPLLSCFRAFRPTPPADNTVDKDKDMQPTAKQTAPTVRALFGAGCFWGVEAAFRRLDGVVDTAVGYSGGDTDNPDYRAVCAGIGGHAETVLVTYDPQRIGYEGLLQTFWACHDPTQINRQGPDVGLQYRSVIFCFDEEQQKRATASRTREEASGRHAAPIATQILPARRFWRAEEYHQRYLEKRGADACGSPHI